MKKQSTRIMFNKKSSKRVDKYVDDENLTNQLEFVSPTYKDEVERQLKDIYGRIEDIGKICDAKMARSYDEYNNNIKSSKAQLWDDLTKLNFKLIEIRKQNTKEDYMNKLKNDLTSIKLQVQQKDKELEINNKTLVELEGKMTEFTEEKEFLTNELANSKCYNKYLQSKLKELESMDPSEFFAKYNEGADNFFESQSKINENRELENNFPKNLNSPTLEDKEDRLEYYIYKNEAKIKNKISDAQKKIKTKYQMLKVLEKFNNPILQLLNTKAKNYQMEVKNPKISSQDIFFKDSFEYKVDSLRHLSNKDRKEILKNFLEDEEFKRYLYNLLFEDNN